MTDIIERLRGKLPMVWEDEGFMIADEDAILSTFKEAADEIERLRDAVRLGVEARQAQRAYFKDRTQSNLVASKQAEAAFDKAARAALGEKE